MADIETSNITPTGNWDFTGGDIKVPAPTVDSDASTKKYVDDNAGGAPEGTAVKSTGVSVGYVLQADGDDTCSWVALGGGGDALTSNPLSQFAATTSAQLAGVISDETGSGSLVFATSPTLVTPALGTPSSGTLSSCTGYPSSAIDHDSTSNYVANEHIDWTTDQGATNIHSGNIPDLSGTYQPLDADLTAIAGLSSADSNFIVGSATGWVVESGATVRTSLGLAIGTDVQAHATVLDNTTASFTSAQETKLSGIETGADVTDTTNVVSSLSGATLTGALVSADHGTASTAQIISVCYGTSATPPTASTTPEGTLYIQYTA